MGIIAKIIMLLNAKKVNDIVKNAINDPQLKKKMKKLEKDAEDLKDFIENNPILKSIRMDQNSESKDQDLKQNLQSNIDKKTKEKSENILMTNTKKKL